MEQALRDLKRQQRVMLYKIRNMIFVDVIGSTTDINGDTTGEGSLEKNNHNYILPP